MFNHISVTPHEKRPRVTSAVVATINNDEVLLVDPENAGSSIPSSVVPGISGQEQWNYYNLTSTTWRLRPDVYDLMSHPLHREQPHI